MSRLEKLHTRSIEGANRCKHIEKQFSRLSSRSIGGVKKKKNVNPSEEQIHRMLVIQKQIELYVLYCDHKYGTFLKISQMCMNEFMSVGHNNK